jgi:hypothetical protein
MQHSLRLVEPFEETDVMNIEARIAAARARNGAQSKAQLIGKTVRREQGVVAVELVAAATSEKTFDIANNTVGKILVRSDLSDKGKLEAMVELLSAKDKSFSASQKTFVEFEEYFTYEQSKRAQISEQNIQRLMDELEDGTKAKIDEILLNFNKVNEGAGTIKKLLTVMQKARAQGNTVEALTGAYKLNENLLRDLAVHKAALDARRIEETSAIRAHDAELERKTERDESLVNKFIHALGFEESFDWDMDSYLYICANRLARIQERIQAEKNRVSEEESRRDKSLEDGELTILRTIDASERGFTEQIVQTAKDSLALIKSTRASIDALIANNVSSRAASLELTSTLNNTTSRETIFKGALQVVAKETHLRGESLSTELDKLTSDKAATQEDEAQAALTTVEIDKLSRTHQWALHYEQTLNSKVMFFEMLASNNVQAEVRVQQFASLVESHHELLVNLQQQALPVTAVALEMGLQQGVALRDGLLAAGVRDATKRAQEIFGQNLEGATEAQKRIESEKLDQMHAAIEALGKAQALIAERTESAIESGLASMALVEKVTASAEGVRSAMAEFQKVGSALTAPDPPPPVESETPPAQEPASV